MDCLPRRAMQVELPILSLKRSHIEILKWNLFIFLIDSTTNLWFWIIIKNNSVIKRWGGCWENLNVNTKSCFLFEKSPLILSWTRLCQGPWFINKKDNQWIKCGKEIHSMTKCLANGSLCKLSCLIWKAIKLLSSMPNHLSYFLFARSWGYPLI